MTRKELIRKLAKTLKHIRQTHKLDVRTMAAKLNIDKSTYIRNENGNSLPEALTLYTMGENLNISLDWFIRDKGPMYFTEERPVKIVEKIVEKEVEKKEEIKEPPKPHTLPPILQNLEDDLKELFESMQQSSLLRYEMLAHYLKLKKTMRDEGTRDEGRKR